MSVEVGTAYITLVPSLKGFTGKAQVALASSGIGATMSRVAGVEATKAGTKAGGFFSRAFIKAQARAGGSGLYVAGLLRNLRTYGYAISGVAGLTVGFGLKTASSFQQARIAFDTMLGSARKAKALFAQLVQFAKTTPFDLPGVVSASQKLLAFGFRAKSVKPILTSIGDAAAGLGLGADGLDRITVAIGQIAAKGRLQSDELLQLTEAGVPALRILANEFGTSTAALQKMVGKGLVPANKAIPALLRGIETGTKGAAGATAKFGGLMQRQSKTLGGLFSNLKDSLSIGLAKAVKPLVPILERVLPRATAAIGRGARVAARDMGEFLHGLGVAKDRSKGATTGFETFGSVLRSTAHALSTIYKFISRTAKIWKPFIAPIAGAIAAVKAFTAANVLLNAVLDADPVLRIVAWVGALAAALIYAWHKSETFRDVVKAAFHVVGTVIGQVAKFAILAFKGILDTWLTVVGSIVHAAAKAFGWLPFGIGGKVKAAARTFDSFRTSVDGTLTKVANDAADLGGLAGRLWGQNFASRASLFASAAAYYIKGSGLKGSLAKALGQDKNKAISTPTFTNLGSSLGGDVANGLNSSGGKVAQAASNLVNKILGPLRTLKQQAGQLAGQIVQAITGDTGFGALIGATDSLGAAFGLSVQSIIRGLTGQRDDVRKFRHRLRALQKRGLSKAAAREIAGEGLNEGGQVVAALMGASRGQLKHISALRRQTNAAAHGLGNDIAGAKFGPQIVREMARTRRAVEHAAKDTTLSDKTVRQLERGYKRAAKSVQQYVNLSEADHRHGKKVRQHS